VKGLFMEKQSAVETKTQVFINLPVKDLERSKEFFIKLGYSFNPQFTDQNAACLVISDEIYAMLLVHDFFKGFTKKEIADTSRTAEAIIALSTDSRKKVDELVNKAVKAGAEPTDPVDHGFMYQWGFQDLDGHLWEIFYMDPAHIQS
jgi:uncharacterized protein